MTLEVADSGRAAVDDRRAAGEFFRVAQAFGHDLRRLEAGEAVSRDLRVPDCAGMRRLLCHADEATRAARLASFFQPPLLARRRLGQGMHDRGEAATWAGGPLVESDARGLARHFPCHVRTLSLSEKRVAAGEVWDVSVRGAVWGLDDLEELYVGVNVGTLILEPGAALIVRGNVLSLLCQRLVVQESQGPEARPWNIGILPTPFPVDPRHGPWQGAAGRAGAAGASGARGEAPVLRQSLLGPVLAAPCAAAAREGRTGGDGAPGEAGGHGRNGGMCKLAEITLRELEGSLTVFSQPGAGGDGGDGGHGGDGGRGGDGAPGAATLTETLMPGGGGDGGAGGDGGEGGHGGSGGIASNIYVDLPARAAARVACLSFASSPGRGGASGRGGSGGRGGAAGLGPDARSAAPGKTGADGRGGRPGLGGRPRAGATIFLNGAIVATGEVSAQGAE